MSWVVGRGRGSWVWVWAIVVGKKKVFKKKLKNQIAKSCKIHETKIYSLFPIPIPLPRGQQSK